MIHRTAATTADRRDWHDRVWSKPRSAALSHSWSAVAAPDPIARDRVVARDVSTSGAL
jgi:hypothetical protein